MHCMTCMTASFATVLQQPSCGPGRGSMITGWSVHNQRIEQLWRDLFEGVTHIYYHLFYHLEHNDIFDLSSGENIFSLHYVGLLQYRGSQNVAIHDLYELASTVRITMNSFHSSCYLNNIYLR